MNKLGSSNIHSDRSDHSDQIDIATLFRSKLVEQRLDHSDHVSPSRSGGPSGPTDDVLDRTKNTPQNQGGPSGPSGPSVFSADQSIKDAWSSDQPEDADTHNATENSPFTPARKAEPTRELSRKASNRFSTPHHEYSVSMQSEAFPYGLTIARRPLTHSGRVVSLQAWRNLTEWERNGPNGRIWNGLTRSWEKVQKPSPTPYDL